MSEVFVFICFTVVRQCTISWFLLESYQLVVKDFNLEFDVGGNMSYPQVACGCCRYEDDAIVGHRLYRETRKFEIKRAKSKGSHVPLNATYEWEAVATNFDEFQDVSVSC